MDNEPAVWNEHITRQRSDASGLTVIRANKRPVPIDYGVYAVRKHPLAKWAGEPCLLDGKPAVIVGSLEAEATIRQLPNGTTKVCTWEHVHETMMRDGRFRS